MSLAAVFPAASIDEDAGVTEIVLVAGFARQVDDFRVIARHVAGRAPDIRVTVTTESACRSLPDPDGPRLIVSCRELRDPPMGVLACGRTWDKWSEYVRLRDAGVPVPDAVLIGRDTKLNPRRWGEHVVVKPIRGIQGQGVTLERTHDVRWRNPRAYPEGHPRRGVQLMAQRFVDTGAYPTEVRLMALFGRVLSSVRVTSREPRGVGRIASNSGPRCWIAEDDPELSEIALVCHRAVPTVPVHGIDTVRDIATGRAYVLEINSGGRTWHLSSAHGRRMQAEQQFNLYAQFDALSVAADALIERVRVLFERERQRA